MLPKSLSTALARADALEASGNLAAAAHILDGAMDAAPSAAWRERLAVRIQAAREASDDRTRQSLTRPSLPQGRLGPRLPITDIYA